MLENVKILKGTELITSYNGVIIEVLGYNFDVDKMQEEIERLRTTVKRKPYEALYEGFTKIIEEKGLTFNKEVLDEAYRKIKEEGKGGVVGPFYNELMAHEENKDLLKYIDEDTDLAIVKIKKIGLPVVKFANSEDIVVGKQVIAIGTPITFSLRNSATVGHISGLNRSVGEPYRLVQTDTAITHGNSGGALINMNGELVGITSSGYSGTNTNFAVPVDTVKYVLNQFELYGKVRHISFGAEFQEDWLAELGVPSEAGLTIKGLEKSSPLAKASFKTGDVLVSVDDVAINSIVELNELMKNYLPGDTVKVGVKTNGEIKYADIVLDEKAKTE